MRTRSGAAHDDDLVSTGGISELSEHAIEQAAGLRAPPPTPTRGIVRTRSELLRRRATGHLRQTAVSGPTEDREGESLYESAREQVEIRATYLYAHGRRNLIGVFSINQRTWEEFHGTLQDLPQLEEEDGRSESANRTILIVSCCLAFILSAMALNPRSPNVVFERRMVITFAVVVWIFPSYYCQALQEYLDDPANEDRGRIWSRILFCIHRTMGQSSRQFLGQLHGQPTNWSRAISCFCANIFIANATYLISTALVADETDVSTLYELWRAQATLWTGVNTMHRTLPRPQNPVFRLKNRILGIDHARSFMRLVIPFGVADLLFTLKNNWGALRGSDGYTIAFITIFGLDVVWYTLRLFVCDDPMQTLTGVPGTVTVEVTNLHYMMMAMLSKAAFLTKTLTMSYHTKKVWILTELAIQINALIVCRFVSKKYVPNYAGIPLRQQGTDMVILGIKITGLGAAVCITWLGWRPTG